MSVRPKPDLRIQLNNHLSVVSNEWDSPLVRHYMSLNNTIQQKMNVTVLQLVRVDAAEYPKNMWEHMCIERLYFIVLNCLNIQVCI